MANTALTVVEPPSEPKAASRIRGALSAIFTKENMAYLGAGAAVSVAARAGGVALAGSAGAGAIVSTALPLTFGAAAAGGVSYYRDYRKRCAEALDAGQEKPAFIYSREKAREEGGFWKGFDTDGLKTAGKKSLFGLAGGTAILSAIEFVPESWVEKLTESVKGIFPGLFSKPEPEILDADTERLFTPAPLAGDDFEVRWAPAEEVLESDLVPVMLDDPANLTTTEDVVETLKTETAPAPVIVPENLITPEQALANFTALPAGDRVASLLFNIDLSSSELPRETMLQALDGHNWAIKDLAHFYANGSEGLPKDLDMAAKLAMISADQGHGPSAHFLTDLGRVGVDVDAIRTSFAENLAEKANSEAAELLAAQSDAEQVVVTRDDTVDISVSVVEAASLTDQIQALDGLSDRAEAIRQAALGGDSQSLGDMGLGLVNERYGFPKDETLGVQLVMEAAEQGNTNHRIWAAYFEYHGAEGLEADPNAALAKMREINHPDARAFAAAWSGETVAAPSSGTTDTLRIASIRVTGDATCYVKGTTEAFNLECHNVDEAFGSSNAQIGMIAPDGTTLDPILLRNISPNATPRDIILSHVREQIMRGNWKPEDMGLSRS